VVIAINPKLSLILRPVADWVFCAWAIPGKLFCFEQSVGASARTRHQASILKKGLKQLVFFFYTY